ncbi:DinB family protein [Chitinophaga sp. sic0106]|uniref:DinB family protein n=1 Tax=Chitinophaga sp. sic0106 TaxID=2854785 RepID=UPI001C48CDE0|nr:DinB family protein [Chitinophaga sp. sic0106]MBV7530163.1 DinB family protein [Chitinophaga sp. sic0106]
MSIINQLAKHNREVYFGGNWTTVNFRDTLSDVTWEQATTKLYDLNTIAALVYHMTYYMEPIRKVLQGGELVASDKQSWETPAISSETEWKALLEKALQEAEQLHTAISQLEDGVLESHFTAEKYGNYFRNLVGLAEHTHYHLGQIVIIKKVLQAQQASV